jgi:hypothetical protein
MKRMGDRDRREGKSDKALYTEIRDMLVHDVNKADE